VHFVNQDYEIMAKHFTKRFVNQSGIGLASQRVTEFPLHHGKRGLDDRTLVQGLKVIIFYGLIRERVIAFSISLSPVPNVG